MRPEAELALSLVKALRQHSHAQGGPVSGLSVASVLAMTGRDQADAGTWLGAAVEHLERAGLCVHSFNYLPQGQEVPTLDLTRKAYDATESDLARLLDA